VDEAVTDGERLRRFEVTTGVEIVVHGDGSRLRPDQRRRRTRPGAPMRIPFALLIILFS
jgi:hypothetical protein